MSSENKAIAAKNDALDQAQKRKISEQRAVAEKNRAEASALVAEATSLLDIDPEQSLQLALQSAPMASTSRARGHPARRVDECPGPRSAAERERGGHCNRREFERSFVGRAVERERHGRHASDERGRDACSRGRSGGRGEGLRVRARFGQTARAPAARRAASGRSLHARREVRLHRRRKRRDHSVGRSQRRPARPSRPRCPDPRARSVARRQPRRVGGGGGGPRVARFRRRSCHPAAASPLSRGRFLQLHRRAAPDPRTRRAALRHA